MIELLWILIHKQVVEPISTKGRPELKCLRRADESYEAWLELPGEEIVSRWMKHQLGLEGEKASVLGDDEVRFV